MADSGPWRAYSFGDFRLDRDCGALVRRDDSGGIATVGLGSRALAVLAILVERSGELVPKDAIMSAVWPGSAVEDANLTVQISTLRRVLGRGPDGSGWIQTVSGRGYRFIAPVRRLTAADLEIETSASQVDQSDAAAGMAHESPRPPESSISRPARHISIALVIVALFVVFAALGWRVVAGPHLFARPQAPSPRLSLVVLPFQYQEQDPDLGRLTNTLTATLTMEVARIPGVLVMSPETVDVQGNGAASARRVASELNVRYAIEGNVHRTGDAPGLNIRLIAAANGAHLWADSVTFPIAEETRWGPDAARRLARAIERRLLNAEEKRLSAQPPESLDADDLMILARALRTRTATRARNEQMRAYLQRALHLAPDSVPIRTALARALVQRVVLLEDFGAAQATIAQARALLTEAREREPGSAEVRGTHAYILRAEGRYEEALAASLHAIQTDPDNVTLHNQIAVCSLLLGRPADAVAALENVFRLDPDDRALVNHRLMGMALVRLHRDDEAIDHLRRALENGRAESDAKIQGYLAVAYAHTGRIAEARRALKEAPVHLTLRFLRHMPQSGPDLAEQAAWIADGYKLSGLRDSVDENVVAQVPPDTGVRTADLRSPTPMTVPGARTIGTGELRAMLDDKTRHPIVIDTSQRMDIAFPGALSFPDDFTTQGDPRLRELEQRLSSIAGGDRGRPIVVTAWNAERWSGRNLALHLVALGYTEVHWYRGGLEAWDLADLPLQSVSR